MKGTNMSLTHTHVNQLRKTYKSIDTEFPKAVTKALADFDTITAARIEVPSTEAIADAIASCMLAGTDPLADPKVLRFAASRALTTDRGESLGYAVAESAERHVLAAVADCADQILDDLGKAAAKPGQQLAAAFSVLGDVDLENDMLTILKAGPTAARAWSEASEAIALLRVIDRGWHSLAELTQFASTTSNPTLRHADLSLEQYEQVMPGRTDRPADVWAIVKAGGTIDLADRVTFGERVQRITEARVERQASAEKTAVR